MQRIIVIGNSGAGKSTLAGQVAAQMGVPHIELDALHWEADWAEAPLPRFRERFTVQFFSRESLFLWVVSTHARHRREYPERLARPEYAHLTLVRLRSPREAARWLASVR